MPATIPVINIENLAHSQTLRALDSAFRRFGACYVVGHGIPQEKQQHLMAMMQAFFHLRVEQKQALARTENNHWGYYDHELTKNKVDQKEIYDYGRRLNQALKPQWPRTLPQFQAAIEDYFLTCEQLALILLQALATNLGVQANLLEACFRPENSSFLRLNYYPVRAGESALGINPHSDAGALTILLQEQQAGLEIYTHAAWQTVEPIDGTLLVNLGDVAQVWSNDRYRAPLHRVRASERCERYSAAFFFNPALNTVYQPLASSVDVNNTAKYRPISWGQFRAERARGDYHDRGHEIQISDFKL